MKRTPFKKKPYIWKRSSKPMNKVGKKGKLNVKADRDSKQTFIKQGMDCCQLCGRTGALSRSHSLKRRFDQDLTRVALLCIFVCHSFIELELDSDTRERINEFVIDTTLEGEDKFNAVLKMMPLDKANKFRTLVLR